MITKYFKILNVQFSANYLRQYFVYFFNLVEYHGFWFSCIYWFKRQYSTTLIRALLLCCTSYSKSNVFKRSKQNCKECRLWPDFGSTLLSPVCPNTLDHYHAGFQLSPTFPTFSLIFWPSPYLALLFLKNGQLSLLFGQNLLQAVKRIAFFLARFARSVFIKHRSIFQEQLDHKCYKILWLQPQCLFRSLILAFPFHYGIEMLFKYNIIQ